jgi:hypothetical protein
MFLFFCFSCILAGYTGQLFTDSLVQDAQNDQVKIDSCGFHKIHGPALLVKSARQTNIVNTGFGWCSGCAFDISSLQISFAKCCVGDCSQIGRTNSQGRTDGDNNYFLSCSFDSVMFESLGPDFSLKASNFSRNRCSSFSLLQVQAWTESYFFNIIFDSNKGRHIMEQTGSGGTHLIQTSLFTRNSMTVLLSVLNLVTLADSGFFGEQTPDFVVDKSKLVRFARCLFSDEETVLKPKLHDATLETDCRFACSESEIRIPKPVSEKCWNLIIPRKSAFSVVVLIAVVMVLIAMGCVVYFGYLRTRAADQQPLMYTN